MLLLLFASRVPSMIVLQVCSCTVLFPFRVVGRPKTDYTNMTARTENLTDFNRYDIINKLLSLNLVLLKQSKLLRIICSRKKERSGRFCLKRAWFTCSQRTKHILAVPFRSSVKHTHCKTIKAHSILNLSKIKIKVSNVNSCTVDSE